MTPAGFFTVSVLAASVLGVSRAVTAAIVAGAILVIAALLWFLLVWRPRHRKRQANTARQLFGDDETATWRAASIDDWTEDERDTALRYYNTAGRQARIGGIRVDLIPPRHRFNVKELAKSIEPDDQERWADLVWLSQKLQRQRRAQKTTSSASKG